MAEQNINDNINNNNNDNNNNNGGLIQETVNRFKYYYSNPTHVMIVFLIFSFVSYAMVMTCYSVPHFLGFSDNEKLCLVIFDAAIAVNLFNILALFNLFLARRDLGLPTSPPPVNYSTLQLLYRVFILFIGIFLYFFIYDYSGIADEV